MGWGSRCYRRVYLEVGAEMNIKLLKQVRDYISKHPQRYDQSRWCGTACCVAGTAAFLSGEVSARKVHTADRNGEIACEIRDIARKALRLSEEKADRLFNAKWEHLPERYQVADCMDGETQAAIAYDRINRFIETRGAE
jgi:hypothetical protein